MEAIFHRSINIWNKLDIIQWKIAFLSINLLQVSYLLSIEWHYRITYVVIVYHFQGKCRNQYQKRESQLTPSIKRDFP